MKEITGDKTTIIRVETALSRFPIHKLSPNDKDKIVIEETTRTGEKVYWGVYKRPGALAYKLDTRVINRCIDEVGKPVPEMIRIGTLREIAGELNHGRNTNDIKDAIRDSAWAVITAKITYTLTNGKKKSIQKEFPRCKGIYFVGDELPNGEIADSVYLVLNEDYREILNEAQTRPLDYEFLKKLTPLAQRLYELLSFRMYAAIRYKLTSAKLLYSEFCKYAPQTRGDDYDYVKKQMYKLHKQLKENGYIESVKLEAVPNDPLDWTMNYAPGQKAVEEYDLSQLYLSSSANSESSNKIVELPQVVIPEVLIDKADDAPKQQKTAYRKEKPALPPAPEVDENTLILINELESYGIKPEAARDLAKNFADEARQQLDALPYQDWSSAGNFSGLLVKAIKEKYSLPAGYFQAKAKKELKSQQPKELILPKRLFSDDPCPVCHGTKTEVVKGKGARNCVFCIDEYNQRTGKKPLDADFESPSLAAENEPEQLASFSINTDGNSEQLQFSGKIKKLDETTLKQQTQTFRAMLAAGGRWEDVQSWRDSYLPEDWSIIDSELRKPVLIKNE